MAIDIFAFSGLAAIYYFFLRKKQEDVPIQFNYQIQPAQAPSSSSAPKGFMDKMKKSNRRMVVFYGSQTGTAEEFAARLGKAEKLRENDLIFCLTLISRNFQLKRA